jgi:WG containing repeat
MTEYPRPFSYREEHWGYVDFSCSHIVIPPQFSYAYGFSEGVAAVKVGEKWGFINTAGKLAISPQFDGVGYKGFAEGLMNVKIGSQWGVIDHTGSFVIPPKFYHLERFSEGLAFASIVDEYAALTDSSIYGFIDKTGQFAISPRFRVSNNGVPNWIFKNGIAILYKSGLMDEGEGVIPSDGDGDYFCIDRTGNIILNRLWGGVNGSTHNNYKWHDGLLALNNYDTNTYHDGECVFIKPGGEVAFTSGEVEIKYHIIEFDSHFQDGMMQVKNTDGLCGYIDTSGCLVIGCQFYYGEKFSEGLAAVTRTKNTDKNYPYLYEYMNKLGETVIPAQFTSADGFMPDGLAAAADIHGKYGLIDRTGQFTLLPQYDWLSCIFELSDLSAGKYGWYLVLLDDEDCKNFHEHEVDKDNVVLLYNFSYKELVKKAKCYDDRNIGYGVINSHGDIISEPIYQMARLKEYRNSVGIGGSIDDWY